MKDFFKQHKVKIISLGLGAVAGFLYWRFIGCASGTCPITSKWYTSSAYGMLFGWLFSDFFTNKSKVNTPKSENE
jgi:hypothetical protein